MLVDIIVGKIVVVVVWDLDWFYCCFIELEVFMLLVDEKWLVLVIVVGDVDLVIFQGWLVVCLKGLVVVYEIEYKKV